MMTCASSQLAGARRCGRARAAPRHWCVSHLNQSRVSTATLRSSSVRCWIPKNSTIGARVHWRGAWQWLGEHAPADCACAGGPPCLGRAAAAAHTARCWLCLPPRAALSACPDSSGHCPRVWHCQPCSLPDSAAAPTRSRPLAGHRPPRQGPAARGPAPTGTQQAGHWKPLRGGSGLRAVYYYVRVTTVS